MTQWATNLQQNSLNGIGNLSIAYASMIQPQASAALVLVNGRSESYLKYRDIANYYYAQGYSVYMYDHRGQGLSQRLIEDRDKGHVIDFNHYIEDLIRFIDSVVQPAAHQRIMMLGHSMGGAIVARYLQTQSHNIERAILASPMFDILLPAPKPLIKLAANALILRDSLLSSSPSYVITGHNYQEKAFADNDLTQSPSQYQMMVELIQQYPAIQLGSPTNLWLLQALEACELCVREADSISIPLLLLQAGSDTIVDNKAQDDFSAMVNPALLSKRRFDDARHELFFELEHIRSETLEASDTFLELQG